MTRKPKLQWPLLALACLPAASLHAQHQHLYRTTAEKSLEIPIGYASTTSPQRKVIYSLGPLNFINVITYPGYESGAYVDMKFQAGLTKRCSGTVRLGYYIVRTTSADSTQGVSVTRYAVVDLPERPSSPEGRPLATNEGINHSISQSSMYLYTREDPIFRNAYFNVVMFADSYDRSCVGQTLRVKGDDAHDYHGELIIKNY